MLKIIHNSITKSLNMYNIISAAFKPSKALLLYVYCIALAVGDAFVENQIICVSNTCKTSLNDSMISLCQLLIKCWNV